MTITTTPAYIATVGDDHTIPQVAELLHSVGIAIISADALIQLLG